MSTAPLPHLRWDLFCQVIDNFGDIGVCWRTAAELAARDHQVRLWVDDARALQWMAPQTLDGSHPGVQVLAYDGPLPADGPGDVVVEAFGCEAPAPWLQALVQAQACGQPRLLLNLEYLSAESYVERCHRLPSRLMSGPGAGLTRWFFYPGFTPATGGLLREQDLAARQQHFDRTAWRAARGIAPGALVASLFCYEPAALPQWLGHMENGPAAHLLITPGRATAAVQAVWGQIEGQNGMQPAPGQRGALSFSYLAPCPQPQFDEMLWACDWNLVRGEDSLVRALWAGQAFVWHIYPQHDNAHHAKLDAFLTWLDAPASLRRFHEAWNGLRPASELPAIALPDLREWQACTQAARARLVAQPDLITQVLQFVAEKS